MKKLLSFLTLIGIAFNLSAANVRLYFAQPFSAGLDTNAMVATQISTNILSNGGVVPTGLPSKRITPAADGYATNYFNLGWYAIKNTSSGSAVVINVYDSGATLYDMTNLLQSGFNTYAVTVYGSNPAPSLNSITNALGGMPLLTALTNAIPTNTIIPAVSGFTAIIPTNFDVLGTAAAVQNYASGASNANSTASAAVQSYATAVSNNVVALTSYATGVSNQVTANQLFATNATTGLSNQVSTAQTTANNAIIFGQAVSNNVNGVTSYSTGVSNLLAAFKLVANTNQYIAGANMSATTNGAVVTWSSSGSGSATNSIGIINGAGSGTQLTNSTLLGSVTATNLDARYDSAGAATVATNGLGTMAQASTNSYVLTNALLAITNTVVTSATNAAAAIALNATNAAVITSTNLSASMILNSTNKALATATNSFDALGVATIVSNGVTSAWQAGTNQALQSLYGTNTALLGAIANSTNGQWVPYNQGPFYITTNLIVTPSISLYGGTYITNNAGAFTNTGNIYLLATNNGGTFIISNILSGQDEYTNNTLTGVYSFTSIGPGQLITVNFPFNSIQPSASNLTNWSGVNTNSIGTYWPTMMQLNTASNGLQSQITAGGVNGLTVTNISSNTVYQATNGFGNIVTQNLPGFTNNLVSSSTGAVAGIFNTLITGPTNSAVQSATNFSGLVTAAVIKLATNGTLQVGTNNFLLSISAGTNIIGLNYGADGNFSYKLSAASTWTNSFDSRYTLNQAGGILNANSNGSQLALISWVNIPTNGTATNMSVGSAGASPAPVIAFGRTNQVNGQIIGGNTEISGALVVQSNITISGTYTGNGTGLTNTQAGSLNPAGVTQSYTNAIAASQVTITNPVTVGGITYWLDGTGSHGSNTVNAASGGFDTNRYLVGNPVTQMGTNATAAAQAVVTEPSNIVYVAPWGSETNNGHYRTSPWGNFAYAENYCSNLIASGVFINTLTVALTGSNFNMLTNPVSVFTLPGMNYKGEPGSMLVITNTHPAVSAANAPWFGIASHQRWDNFWFTGFGVNGAGTVFIGFYGTNCTADVVDCLFSGGGAYGANQCVHFENITNHSIQVKFFNFSMQALSPIVYESSSNVNLTFDTCDISQTNWYNITTALPSPSYVIKLGMATPSGLTIKNCSIHYTDSGQNGKNSCVFYVNGALSNSTTNRLQMVQSTTIYPTVVTNPASFDIYNQGGETNAAIASGLVRIDGLALSETNITSPSSTGSYFIGDTETNISWPGIP